MTTLTSAAHAVFHAERRDGMTPSDRVGLAFRAGRVAREARRTRAHAILVNCRARYGQAFEAVMREREQYSPCEPPGFACRSILLDAARRYRWATYVLVGPAAAHWITAWRIAIGGVWTRAEARRRAA